MFNIWQNPRNQFGAARLNCKLINPSKPTLTNITNNY